LHRKMKELLSAETPLWSVLRTTFPSEPFDQNVCDDEFELIDDIERCLHDDVIFETIDVLPSQSKSTAEMSAYKAAGCDCRCHVGNCDLITHCRHCRFRIVNGQLYVYNGTKLCRAVAEHVPTLHSHPDNDETDWHLSTETDDDDAPVVSASTSGAIGDFLALVNQLDAPTSTSDDALRNAMVDTFGTSRLSFTSSTDEEVSDRLDSNTDAAWSIQEDRQLLCKYNDVDGDVQRVIDEVSVSGRTRDACRERLTFLLTLFQQSQ